MRFRIFTKTDGTESLLYDTELGDLNGPVVSPTLKLEYGKAGSLEFTLLPGHPLYDKMHRFTTYVRVLQNEEEIFRGRVLNVGDGMDLDRVVTCEGDLAFLVDSIQVPDNVNNPTAQSDLTTDNKTARASITTDEQRAEMPEETITVARVNLSGDKIAHETLYDHFARFVATHNSQMEAEKQFAVGEVDVSSRNVVQDWDSTEYRDTKTAMESDLVAYYGGYLRTRKTNNVVYLDYLAGPTAHAEQSIVLGTNMVDLQKQDDGDQIFSRLIPVGDDQLTIASVNDGKSYIQDDDLYEMYGAIYKPVSFSGVKDPTELMRQGMAYFNANMGNNPRGLTVKAVDMNLMDEDYATIQVGTVVTVYSDPHELYENLVVISIEYDIQNPENNSYEIGIPAENLSQKQKKEKVSTAAATSAASTRASRASGGVSNLEQSVNRHAASIIDQADKLYTLQADELNVKARVITIEADLLEIHTEALDITATGYVTLTCDKINMNDQIVLVGDGTADYDLQMVGDAQINGDLSVGGDIYGDTYGVLHYDAGTSGYTDLGSAVVGFGTPTASGGRITIPYERADDRQGYSITFNMADTQWAIDRTVASLTATKEGNTTQDGDTVSATFRLHAKNASGNDITSGTQTISLTGSFPASYGSVTFNNIRHTNSIPTGYQRAATMSSIAQAYTSGYISFEVRLDGEIKREMSIEL